MESGAIAHSLYELAYGDCIYSEVGRELSEGSSSITSRVFAFVALAGPHPLAPSPKFGRRGTGSW
jgi:hypothetical protein